LALASHRLKRPEFFSKAVTVPHVLALAKTTVAPVGVLFDPAAAWRDASAIWAPRKEETPQVRLEKLCASMVAKAVTEGFRVTDAIDLLLRSSEFFDARRAHWKHLESISFKPMAARNWIRPQLYQIAQSVAEELERGLALSNEAGAAQARLAEHPGDVIAVSATEEMRKADPLWFLRDAVLPDEVVQGLLGATRQEAARLTIAGMIHHGRFQSLKVVKELAVIWQRDIRRHLRVLASFASAAVPTNVIPESERVDIAAAYARQRAILEAITAA
jgi:hypothetical protein